MKRLPNYLPDALDLASRLARERGPGTISQITISHDDWCSIFQGAPCDCDPDVRESLPRSEQKH